MTDAIVPTTAPVPMHDTDVMTFPALVEMGDVLVRTGLLPSHIRTGAQAAAIVMTGRELNMSPMRALRSLQMVKGKVTEAADSMLARFKTDGGRAAFTALDETRAVLWLRHPNGDEHTETFTLADAKRAGIAGDMYNKYPKAMLRSRAITAGLKSLGWEGGCGVYDPAELQATPQPEPSPAFIAPPSPPEDAPLTDDEVMNAATIAWEDAYQLTLKGQRLGEMSDDRLMAVYEWAKEKRNARVAAACFVVLDQREEDAAERAAASDDDAQDDDA